MSLLEIKNLCFKVKNFELSNISFQVKKGEYFVLLGRSGSGKTILLESIAGFNKINGNVKFDNLDITNLDTNRRNIGFVYQDFALFPNLSVKENILFSKKYRDADNQEEIFDDLVDFLELLPLLDRGVENLSGGEKQRVAIARALFSKPKILLLDEPLSAIDSTSKNSIMKFLKKIQKRYNLTIIHVTHNFREASYLADTIAIILNGKIEQIGKANSVLSNPSSVKIAKFLGFKNIFSVSLLGESSSKLFSIEPNNLLISADKLNSDFKFKGFIEETIEIVDHYKIFVRVNSEQFFIKLLKRDYIQCYLDYGKSVHVGFNRGDICYL